MASVGVLCRCGRTRRYGGGVGLCASGHVPTAHGPPAVYGPGGISAGAHCGTARGWETPKTHEGFAYWDDDHTPHVLPSTWEIFEWVAPRAPNLKAVVFECERNPLAAVVPGFERIATVLASTVLAQGRGA